MATPPATDFVATCKEICARLRISQDMFRLLVGLGMPVRKINGIWYGHLAVIDQWLRWKCNPYACKEPVEIVIGQDAAPPAGAVWSEDGEG
jgi:hypothetical protein